LLILNRNTEAKTVLEKLVSQHPNYVQGLSNLGYYYLSVEGNAPKAELLYNRAIALDPDYEQVLFNKAALLLATNRKAEAQLLLKKIIKRNPNNQKAKMIMQQINAKL